VDECEPRLDGTITRCAELSPIIGIWVALAVFAFLKWMVSGSKKREAAGAYTRSHSGST